MIASNKQTNKHLGANLIKEVKDLYNEIYRTLKKNIEDTRRKYLPYSWIDRINIVKIAPLPKATYRFRANTIKIPMIVFTELENKVLKSSWKNK